MTTFVGIDPGITGAIGVLFPDGRAEVHDIPTVVSGKGTVKREIDAHALAGLLDLFIGKRAVLERTSAMPGQGVASMFSMGVSRGVILGVLGALAVPYVEVQPARWKAYFNLLGADKDRSRTIALQLFPECAPQLARKKDHNRAEALLLARYLQERKA